MAIGIIVPIVTIVPIDTIDMIIIANIVPWWFQLMKYDIPSVCSTNWRS